MLRHPVSTFFLSLCGVLLSTHRALAQNTEQAALPAAALLATCEACHGQAGRGNADGVPRLAGQNAAYLAHALGMFKAGTRASPAMQAVAQTLSDDEMLLLGRFFAAQRPPPADVPAPAPADAALAAAGRALAEQGAGAAIPACFSCHGPGGHGDGARFPAIAGAPQAFLVRRLEAFQARALGGQPAPASMTALAAKLSAAQIRQVAAFLSGIDPRS